METYVMCHVCQLLLVTTALPVRPPQQVLLSGSNAILFDWHADATVIL